MKKLIKSLIIAICFLSCGKTFLEKKPDANLVVPSSLYDLQAMLDNSGVMNTIVAPSLGEISSGDFYLEEAVWNSTSKLTTRNAYVWATDIYEGTLLATDWTNCYRQILYANVVIERADERRNEFSTLLGHAFFIRALAHFQLAQIYAPQYQESNASATLGIPLRLESDVTSPSVLNNLKEVYKQIIDDLYQAVSLLPLNNVIPSRPNKQAALALFSRVYLQMSDFENAFKYAEECLELNDTLLDYAQLDENKSFPFLEFNTEVIYHQTMISETIFTQTRMLVSSSLFDQYKANDNRRSLYFYTNANGSVSFKGSYAGSRYLFTGLSLNEIYLIYIESGLRSKHREKALNKFKFFLSMRYKEFDQSSLNNLTDEQLLRKVLIERRLELPFRGQRWSDLKRLNLESGFESTLTRTLGDNSYVLEPNSKKYVFPIPYSVLQQSDIDNNNR